MMRGRGLRIATACGVGGLCMAAIYFAMGPLRFGLAEATLSDDAEIAALMRLRNDPLIGVAARGRLIEAAPPIEPARLAGEIEDYLSRRPMSSDGWLELARARYAEGAAPERIFSVLSMSQLTGPNEATVMAGRAVFGLSLWSLASAPMKKALTRDLVGGWPQVAETRRSLLRIALSAAIPQTRAEIAGALSARGEQGAAIAARLGVTH